MRMIHSLVSTSGPYLLKNLMDCGKGKYCFTLNNFNLHFCPVDDLIGVCSLLYEVGLKQRLLRYAASALLFTERGVDPCLVSWNRYASAALLYTLAVSILQMKRQRKACVKTTYSL